MIDRCQCTQHAIVTVQVPPEVTGVVGQLLPVECSDQLASSQQTLWPVPWLTAALILAENFSIGGNY